MRESRTGKLEREDDGEVVCGQCVGNRSWVWWGPAGEPCGRKTTLQLVFLRALAGPLRGRLIGRETGYGDEGIDVPVLPPYQGRAARRGFYLF